MKYSINGTGNIVAERDIYSLGGFIPKGRVGGKIASEEQLSQDGECWLSGGSILTRPDVRIKDNAYIGDFFINEQAIHTDGITEFSGNTLIPGYITIRSFATDIKNNVFVKDSFIGVSMDVLCGPASNTTAFPFEQGDFKAEAAKGTLFTSASMRLDDTSACRNAATLRLGRNTYLYIPTGYRARVYWAYYNKSNQLAYSGESTAVAAGLTKLDHSVYRLAMVSIVKADGTAMTPANLLATGAKILGHINSSVLVDIRPESASGQYVMDKSSLLLNTDNFGLVAKQLRFMAGGMYDTNMYSNTNTSEYKLYGTFRNVERLEYTKYLSDSHRTAATRDTYISAYDCPLLRVDDDTYGTSLANAGDLVLRRCIVPKATFDPDPVNGDTYEDIDFSYANEDLGLLMPGYAVLSSSHKQGLYRVRAGVDITQGLVSHKENLEATARLYPKVDYIPLDGNIIEQGAYGGGPQVPYEEAKSANNSRIRTGKPVKTPGLSFPSLPAGYSVKAFYYLDENFIIRSSVVGPASVDASRPYVAMLFGKDDDSPVTPSDFIALNRTLSIINHAKVPEITGSAYVGAGVTVRGDVKLIGDPYVNRLLDVNMWERGTASQSVGKSWEDSKISTTLGNRFRLMDTFPVEPGGLITCNSGYWVECGFFDSNGMFISSPGWGSTSNYVPAGAAYAGIVIKKATSASESGGLIEDSDIPLANVKYLRAFEKRRYITNGIDRTSPKDILLGPDLWTRNSVSTAEASEGKYFKELIGVSNKYLIPKSPINAGSAWGITTGVPGIYAYSSSSWDAVTKFLGGRTAANAALMVAEIRAQSGNDLALSDAFYARMVIEFTPSPRIIVPYGSNTLTVNGMRIRMYDNAVLSRNLNQEGEIVLQGNAVMGYDFNSGSCMCSNGHSDAIIKLP